MRFIRKVFYLRYCKSLKVQKKLVEFWFILDNNDNENNGYRKMYKSVNKLKHANIIHHLKAIDNINRI